MRNLSHENEFHTQFLFHANQSHFHKNGFALRLALKQRRKRTRKWPIHGNCYKDADCENLIEYANTLTAMIHACIISTCGLKIKADMLEKIGIEADSYI